MKCMMKMPKLLYVPCMNVHITKNELLKKQLIFQRTINCRIIFSLILNRTYSRNEYSDAFTESQTGQVIGLGVSFSVGAACSVVCV